MKTIKAIQDFEHKYVLETSFVEIFIITLQTLPILFLNMVLDLVSHCKHCPVIRLVPQLVSQVQGMEWNQGKKIKVFFLLQDFFLLNDMN